MDPHGKLFHSLAQIYLTKLKLMDKLFSEVILYVNIQLRDQNMQPFSIFPKLPHNANRNPITVLEQR